MCSSYYFFVVYVSLLFIIVYSLQSPSYNATAEQFQQLQIISPSLESNFTEAYTLISGSVAAYSLAAGRVNSALSSLPSRVSAVRDSLVRYESAAVSLMDGYLKERAGEIHLNINTTLAAVQDLMSPAVQVSLVCYY